MAIYPGAVFKPTNFGGKIPRNKQGRGILHVAVSNARSLPPWNANTWHFYIAEAAPDGSTDGSGGPAYCEQYVDTEFRAYAAAAANDDAILIETAGGLGSSAQINAEPWTPAQMLRIADIMRWEAAQPNGAPLALLPDSKPGRRGWGPHRLGIQHSRGIGAVPGWLVPGGERWSSAIGKECPGDAKIRQIPTALAMARSGDTKLPTPAPLGDLDMYVLRDPHHTIWLWTSTSCRPIRSAVRSGLAQAVTKTGIKDVTWAELDEAVADAAEQRTELAHTLWTQTPPDTGGVWPIHRLAGVDDKTGRTEALAAGLSEAVKQLGDGDDLDIEGVAARITEAVTASVSDRLLSNVADVVREALGQDNAEQAEAIVAELGRRIAPAI